MKGIRRFQRTMAVTLVGINILVFSSSFYGDFRSALGHAIIGMIATGFVLLSISLFQRSKYGKKSVETFASQSQEN